MKKQFFLMFFMVILSHCSISEACMNNTDCNHNNYCSEGMCQHKSIFPIDIRDTLGFISIMFGAAFSNAGGIGGGGLFIPILLLVLEFYTHEAIPMSKLMIFAGSLTSFFINLKLKHPTKNAVTIEYNLAMLIVPMLLFGTMVGVTLNKVAPSFLILTLLTFVLLINTYKILNKAISNYKTENEEKLIKEDKPTHKPSLQLVENFNEVKNKFSTHNSVEFAVMAKNPQINQELLRIELKKDKRVFPFEKIIYMIIAFVSMILISFIKGTEHTKSILDIEKCSPMYWGVYMCYIPIAVILTYLAKRDIQIEYKYRIDLAYPYDRHDIRWTRDIFYKYPLYGFISGLIAGLVGIGGGLIIGPLLLTLGINPLISTVTSNFLMLFTSSSTSLQFALNGMMNINYGGICTIFSVIGSLFGTITIQYILISTKRESTLIFALAFALILSTILLPTYSIIHTIDKIRRGHNIWDFNSPC